MFLAVGLAAVGWAVLRVQLPPADFTFVNETELKSLDPHNVTGEPEHRILESIFEGLTRLDPKTLKPLPGVAESWDISPDKKVYTFHLRKDAVWSNGEPVTAQDFVYSGRRFLDPLTAAEYAYQAWYIKNARRYSLGAAGIEPGDPVEVELNERPAGALPYARGELVLGTLKRVEGEEKDRTFVVEVDGRERRFRVGDRGDEAQGIEPCRQVLLDFREVGVRAIDDHTLETTLENPTPYWLDLLIYHALLPVNQKCVETYGSPRWTDPEHIVTNGAFRIALRRIRDRIRLTKSDNYWDREYVKLGVIDALAITSQVTMFNLFETGKADWITDPPAIVLRELLKPGRTREFLNPKPMLCTYYYLINTTRKPLDDVRVRRALARSINRREITGTALAAGEVPAYSLVPPGIPGYDPPTLGKEDVPEARQLLAEAGYPDGRGFPKLEILYNTHEAHQTIAQLVRKQWEQNLGITVDTRNEEWGSYLASVRQMEYWVARRAWVGDYLDPNTFLGMFVTGGEDNSTGWSNAEYDGLIAAARAEVDEEKRLEILRRAERILMDEVPIIPMYHYVGKNLVKPYVRGFYGNMLDDHPLRAIWIDRDFKGPNEFMAE
ncbi:MAG TPA: peptide ABC transporter substrate-binding protein [Lacipirellulaceae bacterium]|jgi:oligopeptide transport system substrate-binding protein